MLDYDSINEKYAAEEEAYWEREYKTKFVTPHKAYTLDDYIYFLKEGAINVELDSRLNMYIMPLLEDKWFHQWPMVRQTYASRLLHGICCKRDVEGAIDILLPLADQGYAGALYDIGYCYIYGLKWDRSYEIGTYLWIESSRRDYHEAQRNLKYEYEYGGYKNMLPCFKLNFVREIKRLFMEEHEINEEDAEDKLDAKEWERFRKLERQIERFQREHDNRPSWLDVIGLSWGDENNPHKLIL